MRHFGLVLSVVCLGLPAGNAAAQNVTVQLPTFQVFSVATTVVVPDRGTAFLGGVKRAASGSTTSGVPGLSKIPGLNRLVTNRGIGSEVSSSTAHVAATILDLDELDKAVLAEAAARRAAAGGSTNPATERKAAFIARHIARNDRSQLPASVPPPATSKTRRKQ